MADTAELDNHLLLPGDGAPIDFSDTLPSWKNHHFDMTINFFSVLGNCVMNDLLKPMFHDETAARQVARSAPLAQWPSMPTLRQDKRSYPPATWHEASQNPAREETPGSRGIVQVQCVPRTVYRDCRYLVRAQPYPIAQMARCYAHDDGEQGSCERDTSPSHARHQLQKCLVHVPSYSRGYAQWGFRPIGRRRRHCGG